MSRRKPRNKRGLTKKTSFKTSKRVIRKPLNIRSVPINYLTQRLPRRNNRYIATHQTVSKPQKRKSPNLLQQVQKAINKGFKRDCIEKKRKADQSRRRNFFRAKGKGGTSQRPEHNRRYKKC